MHTTQSEPETVSRFIIYKPPNAIKTVRQQPLLDIVRLPDTEYTSIPSLQISSKTDSSTRSKLYPPLKPLRKPSTYLSDFLEFSSQEPDYIPTQESQCSILVPQHFGPYNLSLIIIIIVSRRRSTDSSTLKLSFQSNNSALRLVIQHAQPISTNSTTFKQHTFRVTFSLK